MQLINTAGLEVIGFLMGLLHDTTLFWDLIGAQGLTVSSFWCLSH